MAEAKDKSAQKTVELYPGKKVKVAREYLLRDVDFIRDLTKAKKEQDFGTIIDMTFALLEEGALETTRQHIIKEKGYFDIEELGKVLERINAAFPKAYSPAQKRW